MLKIKVLVECVLDRGGIRRVEAAQMQRNIARVPYHVRHALREQHQRMRFQIKYLVADLDLARAGDDKNGLFAVGLYG